MTRTNCQGPSLFDSDLHLIHMSSVRTFVTPYLIYSQKKPQDPFVDKDSHPVSTPLDRLYLFLKKTPPKNDRRNSQRTYT